MLEILLRIIASKGTQCSAELAHRLGVSQVLMGNMLEELARQGYLKTIVVGCSASCERCPMITSCQFRRQARIWMLSQKGERLLARR
jgi:hypothetical protein